ncbi:hypothetical protein RhiirB3_528268 [Rhizophagus irregularis]|nr:hypothetical protein RhiirB3_528268 [Rhizophagus irregularis]
MHGKEVSKTHRKRIIGAYLSGIRQRVISTQFGIPTSTVNDIIKKYKETGSTEPKKRSRRPKVLTERDTQALKRIIRTRDWNRFCNSRINRKSFLNRLIENRIKKSNLTPKQFFHSYDLL